MFLILAIYLKEKLNLVQTGTKHVPSIWKHRNFLKLIVQVLITNLYFISTNCNDKMIVLIDVNNLKIFKISIKWYMFGTVLYHV